MPAAVSKFASERAGACNADINSSGIPSLSLGVAHGGRRSSSGGADDTWGASPQPLALTPRLTPRAASVGTSSSPQGLLASPWSQQMALLARLGSPSGGYSDAEGSTAPIAARQSPGGGATPRESRRHTGRKGSASGPPPTPRGGDAKTSPASAKRQRAAQLPPPSPGIKAAADKAAGTTPAKVETGPSPSFWTAEGAANSAAPPMTRPPVLGSAEQADRIAAAASGVGGSGPAPSPPSPVPLPALNPGAWCAVLRAAASSGGIAAGRAGSGRRPRSRSSPGGGSSPRGSPSPMAAAKAKGVARLAPLCLPPSPTKKPRSKQELRRLAKAAEAKPAVPESPAAGDARPAKAATSAEPVAGPAVETAPLEGSRVTETSQQPMAAQHHRQPATAAAAAAGSTPAAESASAPSAASGDAELAAAAASPFQPAAAASQPDPAAAAPAIATGAAAQPASSGVAIQAVCIVRPSPAEQQQAVVLRSKQQLDVGPPGADRLSFRLDRAFGNGGADAFSVAPMLLLPLIQGLLTGSDANVIAYGQSGSGKSHMLGLAAEAGGSSSAAGGTGGGAILPWAAQCLFEQGEALQQRDSNVQVAVSCAVCEVAEGKVLDLLRPSGVRSQVAIQGDIGDGFELPGLKQQPVSSADELQDAVVRGCANRKSGASSSRSHLIVRVAVTLRRRLRPSQAAATASGMAPEQRAVLQLADLAGSEPYDDGNGVGIERGVFWLQEAVRALADGQQPPVSNHALTKLLSTSLLGQARTLLLACVSPSVADQEHTVHTLRFASQAHSAAAPASTGAGADAAKPCAPPGPPAPSPAQLAELRAAQATAEAGAQEARAEADKMLSEVQRLQELVSQLCDAKAEADGQKADALAAAAGQQTAEAVAAAEHKEAEAVAAAKLQHPSEQQQDQQRQMQLPAPEAASRAALALLAASSGSPPPVPVQAQQSLPASQDSAAAAAAPAAAPDPQAAEAGNDGQPGSDFSTALVPAADSPPAPRMSFGERSFLPAIQRAAAAGEAVAAALEAAIRANTPSPRPRRMRALQEVAEVDHEADRPVARGLDFASSSASPWVDAEPTLELAPAADLPLLALADRDAEAALGPTTDIAASATEPAVAGAAASPTEDTVAAPAAPAAPPGDASRRESSGEHSPEPPSVPSAPLAERTASPRQATKFDCQPASTAAAAAPQQQPPTSSHDCPGASAVDAATQPASPPSPLQPQRQQRPQQDPDGPPGRQSMDLREKRPSLDVRGSAAPPAKRPKSGDLKAAAGGSPAATAAAAAASALVVISQDPQLGGGSEAELAAALEQAAADRAAMQQQLDEAHDQIAVHRHDAEAARAELRVTRRQLEDALEQQLDLEAAAAAAAQRTAAADAEAAELRERVQALEAEAEALLRQLRSGGGSWGSLKRGLQAAWGKPPTPRRPQLVGGAGPTTPQTAPAAARQQPQRASGHPAAGARPASGTHPAAGAAAGSGPAQRQIALRQDALPRRGGWLPLSPALPDAAQLPVSTSCRSPEVSPDRRGFLDHIMAPGLTPPPKPPAIAAEQQTQSSLRRTSQLLQLPDQGTDLLETMSHRWQGSAARPDGQVAPLEQLVPTPPRSRRSSGSGNSSRRPSGSAAAQPLLPPQDAVAALAAPPAAEALQHVAAGTLRTPRHAEAAAAQSVAAARAHVGDQQLGQHQQQQGIVQSLNDRFAGVAATRAAAVGDAAEGLDPPTVSEQASPDQIPSADIVHHVQMAPIPNTAEQQQGNQQYQGQPAAGSDAGQRGGRLPALAVGPAGQLLTPRSHALADSGDDSSSDTEVTSAPAPDTAFVASAASPLAAASGSSPASTAAAVIAAGAEGTTPPAVQVQAPSRAGAECQSTAMPTAPSECGSVAAMSPAAWAAETTDPATDPAADQASAEGELRQQEGAAAGGAAAQPAAAPAAQPASARSGRPTRRAALNARVKILEHVEADNEGGWLLREGSTAQPAAKSAAKRSAAKLRGCRSGASAYSAEQQNNADDGDGGQRSSDSSNGCSGSTEAVTAVASAQTTACGSGDAQNDTGEPKPLQAAPQQTAQQAALQQPQRQQSEAVGEGALQLSSQPSQQHTAPTPEQPRGQQQAAPQQQKRRRRLGTNRALPPSPDPEEEYGPSQRSGVDASGLPRARASKEFRTANAHWKHRSNK